MTNALVMRDKFKPPTEVPASFFYKGTKLPQALTDFGPSPHPTRQIANLLDLSEQRISDSETADNRTSRFLPA